MVDEAEIREALQMVEDPELGISIQELGLVYAVRFEEKEQGLFCEIEFVWKFKVNIIAIKKILNLFILILCIINNYKSYNCKN